VEMRNRISSLENQLFEDRESRRRADTIIAQLTQANAALAARVPELEAAESYEDGSEGAAQGQAVSSPGISRTAQTNLAAPGSRGGGGRTMDDVTSLKLDDVRTFEYLKLNHRHLEGVDRSAEWVVFVDPSGGGLLSYQTSAAPCVRCGRYTEDPNRDCWGFPRHEDPEDDIEVVCDDCQSAALSEALEEEMSLVLEDKLGLAELHRDTLKSFIETIFTDPQKILQVQHLDNRVRCLEKQTNRLWIAVGIEGGLLAALITSVVTMALAS
jgi:hypothetical protein